MKFKKLIGFAALVLSLTFGSAALAADEATIATQDTGPMFENIKTKDHVIGSPDAKITIIEYASLTCPHCANFHVNTFKKFKTNYIDTGKVRFIYRNFHLDQLAFAGAMLAQCAPDDQYFPIVDLIFSNQDQWIRAEKQFASMVSILKLVGYSDEKVSECFAQKQTISDMLDDRKYASEELDVNSTPTLFVNGEKFEASWTYDAFAASIDKLLAE